MEVSLVLLNRDVPSIEVSQRRDSTMPCKSIPYVSYILPLAIYKLCQAAELVLPDTTHPYCTNLCRWRNLIIINFTRSALVQSTVLYLVKLLKSSKFFVFLNSQIVQRIRGQSIQARGSFQNGALQKFQAQQLTQEDHFWTCKSRGFFSSVKGATSRLST